MAEEKVNVKASRMQKGRKSINYLQKLKDEGTPIVQMCPGPRDQYFTMAAEMAGCDICRLTVPGDGMDPQRQIEMAPWWLGVVRRAAKFIHINFFMQTPTYASKEAALANGALYMSCGADSLLPMGINNETLKYMADNYLVVMGHIGALSGWQTGRQGGYKRLGQTAESAMEVFKMGYEYQENGMMAMTIELTPIEVTNAIAKKLRVPVISIAAGGAADGCEMVDFDTFNMMPSPASHAKAYAEFFPWAVQAYSGWANDVRTGVYPEDKHGYHMDEKELDKFITALDNF
ncbi:MAG: 3-methyl-2-oxobutanoate hydroxymethyltransferase [Lachnospiraceae bacterium]|jgi:3-methyl-2-oxobutanoate hydroxymethyltransferase|nr:3-methyl-2-oxobutanoate hydroxymethyltransferase [Lachnospiraceae bacterium]MCI8994428.1 3-methyl-2-oxobutanoate hydroxymethyltransferase [Lachnospiraceae bacterium]MCI9133170.1 3-methyl-2-oxobutanoate hydroxymethyltransferase [Lachnospiraceae bacterium]